jgi:hypothetical protein
MMGSRKRSRSNRSTSSPKWRELYFDKLLENEEMKRLIDNGLILINRILITLDSADIREKIKVHLQNGNEKEFIKMREKLPLDFDSVDYPVLSVLKLINEEGSFFIMVGQDENYKETFLYHILPGNLISTKKLEPLTLVFPL